MPKPIIKKQTISADVQFEAGDKLRVRSTGSILVVVHVDDNHTALVDHHKWSVQGNTMNVKWFATVDNQDLKRHILGSELAKALYGGQGTVADLVNEFLFEGSATLQDAINDLPV